MQYAKELKDMGNKMGFVFRVASGQMPMFMEFMVQASRDKDVWNAAIAPYMRYQRSFSELISEGKKEGSFRAGVDAGVTALVLISLAIGVLLQGMVNPDAADWEDVTNKGVQMILEGLSRRKK